VDGTDSVFGSEGYRTLVNWYCLVDKSASIHLHRDSKFHLDFSDWDTRNVLWLVLRLQITEEHSYRAEVGCITRDDESFYPVNIGCSKVDGDFIQTSVLIRVLVKFAKEEWGTITMEAGTQRVGFASHTDISCS
jgi:hypothetical protein